MLYVLTYQLQIGFGEAQSIGPVTALVRYELLRDAGASNIVIKDGAGMIISLDELRRRSTGRGSELGATANGSLPPEHSAT